MNLRRIEKKDLDSILVLEKLLYKDPWNERNFESELSYNDYAYMFVLEENDVVLGYCGFWLSYEFATITSNPVAVAFSRNESWKFLILDSSITIIRFLLAREQPT